MKTELVDLDLALIREEAESKKLNAELDRGQKDMQENRLKITQTVDICMLTTF